MHVASGIIEGKKKQFFTKTEHGFKAVKG